MQKILTQAKHIVIFLLLITLIPWGFVRGFFAYLEYSGDGEVMNLLNLTGRIYYKVCLDAAIISFICIYIITHFIRKSANMKNWLKVISVLLLYVILFFVWQFILIFLLGYK